MRRLHLRGGQPLGLVVLRVRTAVEAVHVGVQRADVDESQRVCGIGQQRPSQLQRQLVGGFIVAAHDAYIVDADQYWRDRYVQALGVQDDLRLVGKGGAQLNFGDAIEGEDRLAGCGGEVGRKLERVPDWLKGGGKTVAGDGAGAEECSKEEHHNGGLHGAMRRLSVCGTV